MSYLNENLNSVFVSNAEYTHALRALNLQPTAPSVLGRLEQIATAINFVPRRRNKKGDFTNIPLKVGSKLWERTIKEEVWRRYKELGLPPFVANNVREKLRKRNTTKTSETEPTRILERNLIKKVAKFQKFYIKAENVNRLRDLYKLIKDEERQLGGIAYATLILTNEDGEVRMVGVSSNYLDTYADFKNRINEIREGRVEGSDEIGDEWSLLLNEFHIAALPIQVIGGKSESMVWRTAGIESKEKFCGAVCLERLGHTFKGSEKEIIETKKKLRFYQEFQNYIIRKNIKVNIIANSFYLTKSCYALMEANGKERIEVYNPKRKSKELKIISPIRNDDIQEVYLYKCPLSDEDREDDIVYPSIIYDEINSHFDISENIGLVLRDDVVISASSEIIRLNDKGEEHRKLFTACQMNINSHAPCFYIHKYLFFDYETIIDFHQSSCMKPYSLSVLFLSDEQLKLLDEYDRNGDLVNVELMRTNNCMTFLGYDCSEKFINWFMPFSNDTAFTFVGFNNASFDNFLLLDGLLNYNQYENHTEFSVNNVFYNGSQLLNFSLDNRHTLFDIRKHLVGSLASNCKSFKIKCCAKKSFNHALAQSLDKEGKLIAYINDNAELKEYNEYDVLATAVLFSRYRTALINIPATKKYGINLKKYITIGSLVYQVFKDHLKTIQPTISETPLQQSANEDDEDDEDNEDNEDGEKKKKTKKKSNKMFGKLSYKHYCDLQKYKIAGRVELFNDIQNINERMCSTDVCSLYPFVMAVLNVYYPCGDIIEVAEYKGNDEIGFYYCDIDQSNLSAQNLPLIYAKKTEIENDWGHSEVLNDYLISNVMIGLLRKYGCSVIVKQGFVFQRREKSSKMFAFILDMMKAKNAQDTLSANNDDDYNPALRETLKLLMNSLSGKVIEGLHTEKTTDISSMYQYEKIVDKATSINFINDIGGKVFVTYEVDAEEICQKQQRPIFLGCLIYDYAKRYMFDMSYSKIGKAELVYTDTDASKFRYSSLARWEEWIQRENVKVPCWEEAIKADPRYENHLIYQRDSKVFGSFEDELDGMIGEKYRFYCVEKKSWSYEVMDEEGQYRKDKKGGDMVKFKFKGVNPKAIIADLTEPFIVAKVINKKDGSCLIKHHFTTNSEQDVYDYCENNKQKSIESGNVGMFFDRLFTTGDAYVISNSFRKIVKNSSKMVEYGDEEKYNALMNKIQVCYSLKHIHLKRCANSAKIVSENEIDDEDD